MNKGLMMIAHSSVHCPNRFGRVVEELECFVRADDHDEFIRRVESYASRVDRGLNATMKEALSRLQAPDRWELFMSLIELDFEPGAGEACQSLA